jgi:hypothetical protein
MSSIRLIAVHVEEPKPGKFVWVLTERGGREWKPVDRGRKSVNSYRKAMADGLLALQSMVEDLDIGPRTDDDSDPEDKVAEPQEASKADAPPASRSYFGFGPAR